MNNKRMKGNLKDNFEKLRRKERKKTISKIVKPH